MENRKSDGDETFGYWLCAGGGFLLLLGATKQSLPIILLGLASIWIGRQISGL